MSASEQQSPQRTQQSVSRPGPGAMPKKASPGNAYNAVARAKVSPISSDPSSFGTVDSHGGVWVSRAGYEDRKVGEWQAGDPAEGLAHFGSRFDDLAVEVATLEARLLTHPEEAEAIRGTAEELRGGIDTAAIVGDLAALEKQLLGIIEDSHEAETRVAKQKEDRRAQALSTKTALADEAEQLAATSTDWRQAGDRFRAIVNEWKATRGLDKKTNNELWARFSGAREEFKNRRSSHFADLDKQRARAKQTKEELIAKAEEIQNSTDWSGTTGKYRDLMAEWKRAGPAPQDVEERLWKRFRAAQDVFFDARKEDQREKDKEFEANAETKQALIDEYSNKIDPKANLDTAKQLLHELQDKWDAIGFVPRGRVKEFEAKIGALEAWVKDAEAEEWQKNDPEALARVAQFENKAEQLQRDADTAAKAGKNSQARKLQTQADQWSEWARTAAEALGR